MSIGLCLYDMMHTYFFEHFLKIYGWQDRQIAISRGAYLPDGHNKIVRGFLKDEKKPDYLLFIEQDTLPPAEILYHIEYYQDPIIGSLYFKKAMPPDPVAYHDDGLNIEYLKPTEIVPMLEKPGLYPVDVVPMGCTAIRRDVFEHFEREGILWFDTTRRPDNGDLVSDDVWFNRHARQLGYQPLLNTATICTHVGNWEVSEHTYRAWLRREIELHKEDGILGREAAGAVGVDEVRPASATTPAGQLDDAGVLPAGEDRGEGDGTYAPGAPVEVLRLRGDDYNSRLGGPRLPESPRPDEDRAAG